MSALAAAGALIEPFYSDGTTITRNAIPAIWNGSWSEPETFFDPSCDRENQRASVPTVFEYYRKHLGKPAGECVYIVGQVGCLWRASADPEYGEK